MRASIWAVHDYASFYLSSTRLCELSQQFTTMRATVSTVHDYASYYLSNARLCELLSQQYTTMRACIARDPMHTLGLWGELRAVGERVLPLLAMHCDGISLTKEALQIATMPWNKKRSNVHTDELLLRDRAHSAAVMPLCCGASVVCPNTGSCWCSWYHWWRFGCWNRLISS